MENETQKYSMINKVYTLVSSETHESVKILPGSYFADIQYAYGKIQFLPVDDTINLDFEFMLEENPHNVDLEKYQTEFHNLMGDILVELLDIKYNKKGRIEGLDDLYDDLEDDELE